jgi:hypothetical protein
MRSRTFYFFSSLFYRYRSLGYMRRNGAVDPGCGLYSHSLLPGLLSCCFASYPLEVRSPYSVQRKPKVMKPTTRFWLAELTTSRRNRIFASYSERKLPEPLSAIQSARTNACRDTIPHLLGRVVANYLAAFHYEFYLF